MFGYIKIQKGDLLVKEYETYKSIYCGLCRQIGKDYSFLSRFVLSYDCAFYAMFLMCLNNSCSGFDKKRCVCNPLKKCTYCLSNNDSLSKASALNIILSYYKIVDDLYDSGFLKKLFLRIVKPFFAHWHKKALKRYPEIDSLAEKMIKEQQHIEKKDVCLLDEACHPTADMLGSVLKMEGKTDSEERILYQIGYGLGRFVYLADAVDDYEKDIKKENFNPFILIKDNIFQIMNNNLSQSLAMTYDAYNLLNIKEFKGITDNIILKGLPTVQKELIKKVKGEV